MQHRVYSVKDVHVERLTVTAESSPVISVTASGSVVTTGWTQVDLAPWMYIDTPKDGILDLDFVATPPTGRAAQHVCDVSTVKSFPVPSWVRGVRIHSSTNKMEAVLAGADGKSTDAKLMGDGLPGPWPFPWWAPNTARK